MGSIGGSIAKDARFGFDPLGLLECGASDAGFRVAIKLASRFPIL
jgi:hypothetical protein